MSDNFRTFKSGEILSADDRAKLSPADRKTYDLEQKIRGLMKLAENSGATSEERDSATQMVSKLIARHQIDVALLREQTGGAKKAVKIVMFEVYLSNRYGMGNIRAQALSRAVVYPLGGQTIWWHRPTYSTKKDVRLAVWLPEDLVGVAQMMIASFTLQMETSMKVAGVQHKRELDMNWNITPNQVTKLLAEFRRSYLMAWGGMVGIRVKAGRKEAEQEATQALGKEIALIDTKVLADKASKDWNKAAYGRAPRQARAVIVSQDGTTAGRKDGRRAQLGINEVGGNRTRSLSA